MEKREKIEQAVKERERVRLDALPKKWNKREEYEFLRVLTGYGVDLFSGVAVPTPDWSRFRTIAKLDRKSDEALSDYYKVFIAMCKRQAGVRLTEEEKGLEGLIEDISEDHARLVLDRLELLSKLKEVGKTSINDDRLLLCQNNLDTPDWWESGKHDKELIRAVMKHGLYQSYQNIFTDPDFSFAKSEREYVAMLEHQWMLAQEAEANKLQAAFYQSSIKKEYTESSAVVEELPPIVKQEAKAEFTETDAVKSEVEGEQSVNEEPTKADEQASSETAEPTEKLAETEPIQEVKDELAVDKPIESDAEEPIESGDAEKEALEIESQENIEETAAPKSPDTGEKMETSTEEPLAESVKSPKSPESPKAEKTTANEQIEQSEKTKAEETAIETTEETSAVKPTDETAVEQMETGVVKSDEIEATNDTESKEIESEEPKSAGIEESTTTEPSTAEEKMETEDTIEQQAEQAELEEATEDTAESTKSEETPMEVDEADKKSEEETSKLAEETPSTEEPAKETADDIPKDVEDLSKSDDVLTESTEEKPVEQDEKPAAVESEPEKPMEITEENVEKTPEIKEETLVEEKLETPITGPTIVEDVKPELNPVKVEEKKIQEECVILDDDDDDIMIVGKGDPDDDEVMNEKEKQSKQLSELLAKARAKFENPLKVRWFRDFALEQRVSHIVYCIEHSEWPVNKTYSAYTGCQGINLDVPLHETVKHMPATIDLIGRRSLTPDILSISGGEPSGKKMQPASLPMQSPSPQLPKMQLPTMPSSGGKKRKRQHIAIDVETERAKLHALLNSTQGAGLTAAQQAALQGKWPDEDKKDTKLSLSSMQPPPAHQHQSIRSSRSEQQQAQNYSSKSSVIPGTSSTLTPIDLSSR